MFIQDISLGVMPMRSGVGSGNNYKVRISGKESQRAKVVGLLQSLVRHDRRDLEELLAGAVGEIARTLSWYGRAPYEIARAQENDSIYHLHGFTSQRLFNFGWGCLQYIPYKDRELWGKSVAFLSRNDLWIVSVPRQLGGYFGYRTTLRKLSKFGKTSPRFWQEDLERHELQSSFDFMRYRREVDIFEARVTRKWGWNRRDYTQRNWTEFMQFYRTLTFKWAQAVLREHIVSELNALFVRLKIDARVKVSGLPPSEEILFTRNDMYDGKLSLGLAYKVVSC
jgi:hypothetical protein